MPRLHVLLASALTAGFERGESTYLIAQLCCTSDETLEGYGQAMSAVFPDKCVRKPTCANDDGTGTCTCPAGPQSVAMDLCYAGEHGTEKPRIQKSQKWTYVMTSESGLGIKASWQDLSSKDKFTIEQPGGTCWYNSKEQGQDYD